MTEKETIKRLPELLKTIMSLKDDLCEELSFKMGKSAESLGALVSSFSLMALIQIRGVCWKPVLPVIQQFHKMTIC